MQSEYTKKIQIITGERIQFICDLFIGTELDLNFNPIVKVFNSKHLNIDKADINLELMNIKNIFCYTNILHTHFNKLYNVLDTITTKFNLILHNSDYSFDSEHADLLKIENLINIYTQNLNIEPQQNIIPIPIGIANSMWPHGSLSIWDNYIFTESQLYDSKSYRNLKINTIYFNFKISTNKSKRQLCYDIISSKNINYINNAIYSDFLKKLLTYKFCICPEGNGIDTHRFWECLYLKTIPICLKNHITMYYSKFFPIYLLNDWNDVNISELNSFYINSKWDNYYLLDFNHLEKNL